VQPVYASPHEIGADGRLTNEPSPRVSTAHMVSGRTHEEFRHNIASATWKLPSGMSTLHYDQERDILFVCRTDTLARLVSERLAPRTAARHARQQATDNAFQAWLMQYDQVVT
jgi:sugar lactone lactonase YvrE